MHQQPGKNQGRLALVRESAAHRQAIASNGLGFLVLSCTHTPLNLTHTSCIFLELSLCVVVGLDNWLSSLFQIVELAELVRNAWQHLLHGQSDWTLGVRKNSLDRHRQGLLDLAQQISQVLLASTVEAAGKQDFTRERVAQYPKHIVSFERLEAVESQDDMTLLLEELLETGLVSQAQSEQFFVALEQVGDGALGNSNMTFLKGAMDFGDTAMLAVAQRADERDDVKAEFAVGQGPCTFLFRANGLAVTGARRIVAAADAQGQASDMLECGNRAGSVVASPKCAATGRTGPCDRLQAERASDGRTFRSASHTLLRSLANGLNGS